MKNLCPLCHEEHTRDNCPRLKPGSVSHGDPRQNLHTVIYIPPPPKPPRRSMFRDRTTEKATPATPPVTKTPVANHPQSVANPPLSLQQKNKGGRPPTTTPKPSTLRARAHRAKKTK